VHNSAEFVAPLKQATFVFIDGGRQWRLADAYLGTLVERELRNVLKRGGVIGGSSAGASILASYLVRGDPKSPEVTMAKSHERGFGFIPNSAIDQHVSERHRERDMEPVVAAHPKLLGMGIDPNTIIVVHQDLLEVLGSGKVTITKAGQQQYSLSSGNHFDLRRRKPRRRNYGLNRVASLEENPTIVCFTLNKASSTLSDPRGGLWHVLLGAAETVASHTCPTHWREVKPCDSYFEQPSRSGLKCQPLFLYFRDIC